MAAQSQTIPNNEIWYWAASKVTLYTTEDVVTHEFANGKGTLTFANDVTNVKNWMRSTPIIRCQLPATANEINRYGFMYASSMSEINIENIVTLNGYAFYTDSALSGSVALDKIETMGEGDFYGCTGITSIIINKAVPPSIGSSAFGGTTFPIYVPAEAVDTYKGTAGWSTYADRIFAIQ